MILKNYLRFIQGLFKIGFRPNVWWLCFQVRRNTMVSPERLYNVFELTHDAIQKHLEGDVAECGVFKGGCVAMMGAAIKKYQADKLIWMFDSFAGLPEPTKEDGERAKAYAGSNNAGKLATIGKCVGQLEDVKHLFSRLHLSWQNVKVEKGWFQDTLPKAAKKIQNIAVLRLDGDWYESTKVCLEYLYPKVVSGGFVIIDDYYYWDGDGKAVDEYLDRHHIQVKKHRIDENAMYFSKP